MLNLKQTMKLLLLLVIALLGLQMPAYAEQIGNSVKDCFDHPESCEDGGNKPIEEESPANSNSNLEQIPETNAVGLGIWDFIKMIFATLFVIALLYLMLRFLNKKNKVYKSTQLVENLGGTSLGNNRSVQIIRAGNRLLIVGVGENIQLLKEIDETVEYDQIISSYNQKMEQLVQPSDIVSKVIRKVKNTQISEHQENPKFQTLLKQQLDEITKGRRKLFEELEKKGPDKQ